MWHEHPDAKLRTGEWKESKDMPLSVDTGPQLGTVETIVTNGRGLNPAELARITLPKLVYLGPDVEPELREKIAENLNRIEVLLREAFAVAQRSQNTTVYNILKNAGHDAAAELVKEL